MNGINGAILDSQAIRSRNNVQQSFGRATSDKYLNQKSYCTWSEDVSRVQRDVVEQEQSWKARENDMPRRIRDAECEFLALHVHTCCILRDHSMWSTSLYSSMQVWDTYTKHATVYYFKMLYSWERQFPHWWLLAEERAEESEEGNAEKQSRLSWSSERQNCAKRMREV